MTDDSKSEARKKPQPPVDYLAWTIVVGFFAMMGLAYLRPSPAGSETYLSQFSGALILAFGMVMQKRYGTTSGSERKTELAAEQTAAILEKIPTSGSTP